jgi:hypothetical protein
MDGGLSTLSPKSASRSHMSSTATGLKARLQTIAQSIDVHGDEITQDKAHLDTIKVSQQGSTVLKDQVEDFKRFFLADLSKLEEEFRVQANLQRAENTRIQQAVNQLKAEKTAVHQQLLAITRRVEEIEEELGHE